MAVYLGLKVVCALRRFLSCVVRAEAEKSHALEGCLCNIHCKPLSWFAGFPGEGDNVQPEFFFRCSFQGRDSKGSPRKRVDVRLSRTSSMERGKEREEAWSFDGATDNTRTAAQESEENKENLILNSELKDDLLLYQDEEALNDSIISGEERVGPACGRWGHGGGRRACA